MHPDPIFTGYKRIIGTMKTQLKETRETLDETDGKYPGIQNVIDANWGN